MKLNLISSVNKLKTPDSRLKSNSSQPIGVFDSGVGGLTVVAALQRILPHEKIIYLGDTARVPYGGKSPETVIRYSIEIADLLLKEGAKMIVVACNTASALGVIPRLQEIYNIPVQGVIDPGAAAAMEATHNKIIGIIGTKGTIASNAYHKALHALQDDVHVISIPCPLLVPLVEEGLFDDVITATVLRRYLEPMLSQGIDTLVLGCTHYPLLKKAISTVVGPQVMLVDSAENCAHAVRSVLASHQLLTPSSTKGTLEVMLTDTSEGFLHLVSAELQLDIESVTLQKMSL